MRNASLLALVFLAASCAGRYSPVAPAPAAVGTASRPLAVPSVAAVPAPARQDPAPPIAPKVLKVKLGGGISGTAVLFDSRNTRLRVADQPGGPGSLWADAEAAALASHPEALAAVNAGFFTPEGGPLGLVISNGQRAGVLNRSSLGGGILMMDGNSIRIMRRESWSPAAGGAGDVLQAGPFLMENGRPIAGLSEVSSTARTFIATDGGPRWALVRTDSCSLAGLAAALNGANLGGGMPLRTALNLDGGRSSDLWASSRVAGGPVRERPFWNKPVRNFLLLAPKSE